MHSPVAAILAMALVQQPAQDKPPITDLSVASLRVDGMTSSACYETVEKAFLALPEVRKVVYWIEKSNYHVHVTVTAPLRLSRAGTALAAAVKEMKERSRMEVQYKLNESLTLAAPEGEVSFNGGEELIPALKQIIDVKSFAARDRVLTARVSDLRPAPIFIAAIREKIEKPGGKLLDLAIRSGPALKASWRCPAACSESSAPGICPKCARSLVETPDRPADTGG